MKRRANVEVEEERGEDREGEEEEAEDNLAIPTPRTGRIAMMSFVLHAQHHRRL